MYKCPYELARIKLLQKMTTEASKKSPFETLVQHGIHPGLIQNTGVNLRRNHCSGG